VFQPAPSLYDLHLVAMRPAPIRLGFSNPRPFIETIGLYNKCVSFPAADTPSHKARLRRVFGQFPSVSPDRAPRVDDFKKLKHAVGKHDELESVVIRVTAWPSGRVAVHRRAGAS